MTALQQEIAGRLDLNPGWDRPCEGSVHHSPTPLLTERYDLGKFAGVLYGAMDPIPYGEDPVEPVHLCGVCADNLMVFVLMSRVGDFPWETQRRFGNKIRDLGHRALAHQEKTD